MSRRFAAWRFCVARRRQRRSFLAFVRQLEGEHPFLVVANLSARAQSVELDLRQWPGAIPTEVFGSISAIFSDSSRLLLIFSPLTETITS